MSRPPIYPCPSEPAYRRHVRRREPACEGCLRAHADYEAQRVAARPPRPRPWVALLARLDRVPTP
jgi:hypothetical protein